jgi:hypothetical protein
MEEWDGTKKWINRRMEEWRVTEKWIKNHWNREMDKWKNHWNREMDKWKNGVEQ